MSDLRYYFKLWFTLLIIILSLETNRFTIYFYTTRYSMSWHRSYQTKWRQLFRYSRRREILESLIEFLLQIILQTYCVFKSLVECIKWRIDWSIRVRVTSSWLLHDITKMNIYCTRLIDQLFDTTSWNTWPQIFLTTNICSYLRSILSFSR